MKVSCDIKKTIEADVAVIGGGTAGIFAAISAAKTGAKVVLIEKNSILGGTMTACCVNFPGLFFAWGKQIIGGPCWEAIKQTEALGGAEIPEVVFHPKHHWDQQIRVNRFIYTYVLSDMCKKYNVNVIANTITASANELENGVKIAVAAKDGLFEIFAKKAIDATGDADLVRLLGYKCIKSETLQPATLQNHISGYDINNVNFNDIKNNIQEFELNDYISADKLIHFLKINKIDAHVPCSDADTSYGKTKLEFDAQEVMIKTYKFLRRISGLENLTIDFAAEETGVRESNRIVGENTVTADDYINGVTYPDSVCYSFYPIDLHVMKKIEQKFHKENVVSKIPYSALIPKNSKNIICAGRCISSDTYANSALRVQATCMATGQAAGCAAALCSLNNITFKELDISTLKNSLKKIGAIVPDV